MTPKPADALAQHWTDRLPAKLKPYAQLSRWDRPIGWQLLLLPCWMGVALMKTGRGFTTIDAAYALLFLVGAIAMRGAGCTYNDILDRDIDAQVARTRGRPIPSGAVSVRAAWVWVFVQCVVGAAVLAALPRLAQITALASLPLIALYPLMKRVTWWPQAWLGLVFNWGALVAGAALSTIGTIPQEALALYAGCIAWTIGYDTIYALQDREDDALVGVKSTARLWGKRWRPWTMLFYAVALFFWVTAALFANASWPTLIAIGIIGIFVIRPMLRDIDDTKSESALAAFKLNAWIGLALVVVFAMEPLAHTLQPSLGR